MIKKVSLTGEQDGREVDGLGVHLSPQIHQEYTFRHRSACRTPAEHGQEYLTSRKEYIDVKEMKVTIRDKEGHHVMIKGSIQEEDMAIVNVCAPSIGAPQCIRQTLTDITGETDSGAVGET